jgi:Glutathione-dependent formaldehyde-activating enzyme
MEGESSTWTFPESGKPPVEFRSCDSGGATYHFCPECGSTVYWELSIAPDMFGVPVGGFTDPTFPPPMIAGFEALRGCLGAERLGPSDAGRASRLRRNITWRETTVTAAAGSSRPGDVVSLPAA